jgi:hypothetical protein
VDRFANFFFSTAPAKRLPASDSLNNRRNRLRFLPSDDELHAFPVIQLHQPVVVTGRVGSNHDRRRREMGFQKADVLADQAHVVLLGSFVPQSKNGEGRSSRYPQSAASVAGPEAPGRLSASRSQPRRERPSIETCGPSRPPYSVGEHSASGFWRVACRVKSPGFLSRLYFIQMAGKIEAFFCLKKNIPSLIRISGVMWEY